MPRKPTPKIVSEVCNLCGLDWSLHGDNPTTETCIELLVGEVRALNAQIAHRPYVQPINIPVRPRSWPQEWPYRPYWSTPGGGSTYNSASHTPAMSSNVPLALTAG